MSLLDNQPPPESYRHEISLARIGLAALIVVVLGLLHGCWIHHEWDLRVEKVRTQQKGEEPKSEGR